MNEEENQAFKILHFYRSEDYGTEELKKYIKIIVNLVDKQRKEIEELKAITRTYEAYNCREDNKIVIASKEYFINGFFRDFLNDYISKDKIKEKIEEYKKKCNKCNFQNTGICKDLKAHYNCSIQSVLELLNELLGE